MKAEMLQVVRRARTAEGGIRSMGCVGDLRRVLGNAGFWMVAGSLAITVLLESAALAAPVTYTAFTITDGQLGRWHFHNARVILPSDAVNYTPATPNLETGLTNATVLSGASSCVAFDPATSICTNLIPLRTGRGNLYLFEPYTDNEATTTGAAPFTVNWSMFWADLGTNNNDD